MGYIEDRKYWKILEGQNLKNINQDVISLLLNKNIIKEYIDKPLINADGHPIKIFLNGEPYLPTEEKESTEFENYMVFGSKRYTINREVAIEIYNAAKFLVEEIEGVNDWKRAEIEIELEGIIKKEEKLLYLENKHSQLFSESKDEPEFLIYIGKREFNGFDNWEDFIIDEVLETDCIVNYITEGKIPTLRDYKLWIKYFQATDLIEFCKSKYDEINGFADTNKATSKGLDTSKQVLLLEAIRNIKEWEELSATKKGKIISLLINKNSDNIKDIYLNMDKKQSDNTPKFLLDKQSIDKLINDLLG